MNYRLLFDMQDDLDAKINEVRKLSGHDVIQERILALLVEIGEFANETRCFKFWSRKPPSEKKVILFEFVDCMHFLLSVGNYSGFTFKNINPSFSPPQEGTITELFIEFFHSVVRFRNEPRPTNYLIMWDYFMSIGKNLEFTEKEMFQAYMEKNQINHDRQASGY